VEQDKRNEKYEIQGFFAALRMTRFFVALRHLLKGVEQDKRNEKYGIQGFFPFASLQGQNDEIFCCAQAFPEGCGATQTQRKVRNTGVLRCAQNDEIFYGEIFVAPL
jgi:hypothetical protein